MESLKMEELAQEILLLAQRKEALLRTGKDSAGLQRGSASAGARFAAFNAALHAGASVPGAG